MSGFNTFTRFIALPFRAAGMGVRVSSSALDTADKLLPKVEVAIDDWGRLADTFITKGVVLQHEFVKEQEADLTTFQTEHKDAWDEVQQMLATKK